MVHGRRRDNRRFLEERGETRTPSVRRVGMRVGEKHKTSKEIRPDKQNENTAYGTHGNTTEWRIAFDAELR